MLRDIPKIYGLMFVFIVIVFLMTMWYRDTFDRDNDVLQLNDTLLAASVSEVDQSSRLYEGALILSETFERSAFDRLETIYKDGDKVQFEYVFDIDDERFDNVESEIVQSPVYTVGETEPKGTKASAKYMTGRPVQALRLKVIEGEDNIVTRANSDVTNPDNLVWTYEATVEVDAVSRRDK